MKSTLIAAAALLACAMLATASPIGVVAHGVFIPVEEGHGPTIRVNQLPRGLLHGLLNYLMGLWSQNGQHQQQQSYHNYNNNNAKPNYPAISMQNGEYVVGPVEYAGQNWYFHYPEKPAYHSKPISQFGENLSQDDGVGIINAAQLGDSSPQVPSTELSPPPPPQNYERPLQHFEQDGYSKPQTEERPYTEIVGNWDISQKQQVQGRPQIEAFQIKETEYSDDRRSPFPVKGAKDEGNPQVPSLPEVSSPQSGGIPSKDPIGTPDEKGTFQTTTKSTTRQISSIPRLSNNEEIDQAQPMQIIGPIRLQPVDFAGQTESVGIFQYRSPPVVHFG